MEKRVSSIKARRHLKRESSVLSKKKTNLSHFSRKDPIKNVLGDSFQDKRVAFTHKDRGNHTHVIGSTGTGKSKFMELMIRQDIQDRKAGLCLLDPHGTLYDEILLYSSHKYPHMADRFVLFDPAGELEQIVGFNPIPENAEENIDYTLDMLISACLKAWGQDNTDRTPRITKWLENIFYTIIVNGLTLVETTPLLSISSRYKNQREKLLSNVYSDVVLDDWDMFKTSTNTQKQMLIEGAANRLRKFLRNDAIRSIIGQQVKRIDLGKIMDEGKILLVNLNGREKISHENTKLLGILLVNEFFRVAKLRDPLDPHLKPFYLYIDEFANFITRDIARAIEECRKFKMFLILAHQHLAQLAEEDEYLYASVMTNCKNKVVFGGLSKEDVEVMTDEISTGFLNLKTIKDEMYTTKVRQVEETRTVRGKSQSYSSGKNESKTKGTSLTNGVSEGRSVMKGSSTSRSDGGSENWGASQSKGSSLSHGTSKGHADTSGSSEGQSWGTSDTDTVGTSQTRTKTHTEGTSESDTHGSADTTGSSDTRGSSDTTGSAHAHSRNESQSDSSNSSQGSGSGYGNMKNPHGGKSNSYSNNSSSMQGHGRSNSTSNGYTDTQNESHSSSSSHSDSRSHTDSQSHTSGRSQSDSQGFSEGESKSHSTSRNEGQSSMSSQSHSDNFSENESSSTSAQEGTSHGEAKTWSESLSHQESTSHSKMESHSEGTSESTTSGNTESQTQGETESIVPWKRDQEYKELTSRTFWTKDEVRYMEMADIKNQDTGQAFIKIGSNAPTRTQITFVKPVYYSPRMSPKRIDAFREKVFEKNSEYYTPALEAREEYEKRQTFVFGEPIQFDRKSIAPPTGIHEEKEVFEDNPFE